MRVVASPAASLLAGRRDESVGVDCGDSPGPSGLPASADVRDRQRAENDQVGIDFAVAPELGGEIVAAAHRAYIPAQKIVGRFVGRVAHEWPAAIAHDEAAD